MQLLIVFGIKRIVSSLKTPCIYTKPLKTNFKPSFNKMLRVLYNGSTLLDIWNVLACKDPYGTEYLIV